MSPKLTSYRQQEGKACTPPTLLVAYLSKNELRAQHISREWRILMPMICHHGQ
jgi:hypothetical protein